MVGKIELIPTLTTAGFFSGKYSWNNVGNRYLVSMDWTWACSKEDFKVTPTTFWWNQQNVRYLLKNVYIGVVHIFWDCTSFVFSLFRRKGGGGGDENSENLWLIFIRHSLKNLLYFLCFLNNYWKNTALQLSKDVIIEQQSLMLQHCLIWTQKIVTFKLRYFFEHLRK